VEHLEPEIRSLAVNRQGGPRYGNDGGDLEFALARTDNARREGPFWQITPETIQAIKKAQLSLRL